MAAVTPPIPSHVSLSPSSSQGSNANDSKQSLIARIKECVYSLFQKLSGLFITQIKSNDDLQKHVSQIYNTNRSKLEKRKANFQKRITKKFVSKTQCKNSDEIFDKLCDPLKTPRDVIKAEATKSSTLKDNIDTLKQELETFRTAHYAMKKLKDQIAPIIPDLVNMVSNEQKEASNIFEHTKNQVINIQKKHEKLITDDGTKSILDLERKFQRDYKTYKTGLEEQLKDFEHLEKNFDFMSIAVDIMYFERSSMWEMNRMYKIYEAELVNYVDACKRRLTHPAVFSTTDIEKKLTSCADMLKNLTWTKMTKAQLKEHKETLANAIKAIEGKINDTLKDADAIFQTVKAALDFKSFGYVEELKSIKKACPILGDYKKSLLNRLEHKCVALKQELDTHESNNKRKYVNKLKQIGANSQIEETLKQIEEALDQLDQLEQKQTGPLNETA